MSQCPIQTFPTLFFPNQRLELEDVRICNVKLSYRAREFQHIVDITTASAGATPNLGDHLVERCVAEKSEVV